MKDFNDINIFVTVIRAGSFTAAAQKLALPLSTVSDRVRALETAMGLALIIRTTRKLQLTDAGQRFFDNAAPAVDTLLIATESAIQCNEAPRGTLRFTAPTDFSSEAIAQAITEYRQKFPEVRVEAVITNRVVDIVGENIDIAVRGGVLKDSSLLSKRLGMGSMALIASPSYLEDKPGITQLSDLQDHWCIGYSPREHTREDLLWEMNLPSKRSNKIKLDFKIFANSLRTVVDLAKSGAGIALVPESMVVEEIKKGDLIRLLPTSFTDPAPISLVYAKLALELPKVREIIPILEKHLKPFAH